MADLPAWRRRVETALATATFAFRLARSPDQRKHVVRWLRSLRPAFLIDEPSPWLPFDVIDFVDDFIDAHDELLRVFEYGSGGSTLYWQTRVASCVSVEHEPRWFEDMRSRIDPAHVDYRLVQPEVGSGIADPAEPLDYASGDASYAGHRFRSYASVIDAFPDESFDIVLVDGRARPSCLMHAAPKVRPGGLLILDNADHEYYTTRSRRYLGAYEGKSFSGAVPTLPATTRTDVFIRRLGSGA